jgi:hypothetical protein
VFTALDGDYTLCLLDPKQPDKADCGDGYIKRFALFDLLKSLYSDTKILSKYIPYL